MRSIQYLFPLITISWSHGFHRSGSVIRESSADPYLTHADGAITRDDLDDMEERLLRVIKNSNRRSRPRDHSSRLVYLVGDHHKSGYSGTRFTGSSHGSKSDKIEIVIKGPPSTADSGHDDVYCHPNCHANPQYASHDHGNCYPYCHHHAAAQAWSHYQPPSTHGSHSSTASQAPVAASVRLPRKAPTMRNVSVQVGSSLLTKQEAPSASGK